MARRPSPIALVLGILLLCAATAGAAETPNVTRLNTALGDCMIGNLNPPVLPSVDGIVTGNEAFAYFVYPLEQCSCSEGGFLLEMIHMMLELLPHQVPAAFQAYGALHEAVYDPTTGCWLPGDMIYAGPPTDFDIQEPGVYEIGLPTPGAVCLQLDNYYFLVVHFLTPLEAGLVEDGLPAPCIAYNDKGAGWVDLDGVKRTAAGKTIIWGDMICCLPPIGSETPTWGAVKTLYR
jgi:hypothetical protein